MIIGLWTGQLCKTHAWVGLSTLQTSDGPWRFLDTGGLLNYLNVWRPSIFGGGPQRQRCWMGMEQFGHLQYSLAPKRLYHLAVEFLFTVAQLSRRNIHPWSQGGGEVWQELPWSCGQGCESLQRLPHFFHGVGPAPEVPPERASRCCWSKSRIKRGELCLVLSHRTNISIYRWPHTWLLCTMKCHFPLHFYEFNIH